AVPGRRADAPAPPAALAGRDGGYRRQARRVAHLDAHAVRVAFARPASAGRPRHQPLARHLALQPVAGLAVLARRAGDAPALGLIRTFRNLTGACPCNCDSTAVMPSSAVPRKASAAPARSNWPRWARTSPCWHAAPRHWKHWSPNCRARTRRSTITTSPWT